MASGAFSGPSHGLSGRFPLASIRSSQSRTPSFSSPNRPSTASSGFGSDAYQDASEEQDPDHIDREFDHVRHLLSLVGSSAHQPGGMAQWAFPRVFRANVSQRRVMEELEALRSLVMRGMASASQTSGSWAGSRPVTPALPNSPTTADPSSRSPLLHPTMLGPTELGSKRADSWEDLASDMQMLTPVVEQHEDPISRSLRERNEQLLGTAEETQEKFGEARSQIERLEALLRQNEQEAEGLRQKMAEQDRQTARFEAEARERDEIHKQRLHEMTQQHEDAMDDMQSVLRKLRKEHEESTSANNSTIEKKNNRIEQLEVLHQRALQEHKSVLDSTLAAKDNQLDMRQKNHEQVVQDLRIAHQEALDAERNQRQQESIDRQVSEDERMEHIQREHDDAIVNLRDGHTRALEAIRRDREEAQETHRRELQERASEHMQALKEKASELIQIRDQHNCAIHEIQQSKEEQVQAHQRALDDKGQELEALRQDHARGLERLEQAHREELQDCRTEALKEAEGANSRLEDSQRAHQARVDSLQKQLLERDQRLDAFQNDHAVKLKKIADRHQQVLKQKDLDHREAIEHARTGYESAVTDLHKFHAQELEEQRATMSLSDIEQKRRLDEVKNFHQSQIDALENRLAEANNGVDVLRQQHQDALDAAKAEHDSGLANAVIEHQRTLEESQQSHAQAMESAQTRLRGEVEDRDCQIVAERAAATKQLDDLKRRDQECIDRLEKQLNAYENDLKQRQQQHEGTLQEVRDHHERSTRVLVDEHNSKIDAIHSEHKQTLAQSVEDYLSQVKTLQAAVDQIETATESSRESHEQLCADLERKLQDQRENHEREMTTMRIAHDEDAAQQKAAMETLRHQSGLEIGNVKRASEAKTEEQGATHRKALEAEQQRHAETREANRRARSDHEHEQESHTRSKREHEQKISELEMRFQNELAQAATDARKRLDEQESQYNLAIGGLKSEHVRALEDVRMSKDALFHDINDSHAAELAAAKRQGLDRLSNAQQEHLKTIAQLKGAHEDDLNDLRKDHSQALEQSHADMRMKLEQQEEAHSTRLQKELSDVQHQHETLVHQLKQEQEKSLESLSSAHNAQLSHLQEQLNARQPEVDPLERDRIIEQERKTWESIQDEIEIKYREGVEETEDNYRATLAQRELEITQGLEAQHRTQTEDMQRQLEELRVRLSQSEDSKDLSSQDNHSLRQRLTTTSTKLYEAERVRDALLERSSSRRETANSSPSASGAVSRTQSYGPGQIMTPSRLAPANDKLSEAQHSQDHDLPPGVKSRLDVAERSNAELIRLNNELRSRLNTIQARSAHPTTSLSPGRLSLDQERPSFWPREAALQTAKERLFGEYRKRLEAMVREEVAREPTTAPSSVQNEVESAKKELTAIHKSSLAELRNRVFNGEISKAHPSPKQSTSVLENSKELQTGIESQHSPSSDVNAVSNSMKRAYLNNIASHAAGQVSVHDLSISPDQFEVSASFARYYRALRTDETADQRARPRQAHHRKAASTGLESKYNPHSLSLSRQPLPTRSRFGRLASPFEPGVNGGAENTDKTTSTGLENGQKPETEPIADEQSVSKPTQDAKSLLKLRKGSRERAAERYNGASGDTGKAVSNEGNGASTGEARVTANGGADSIPGVLDSKVAHPKQRGKRPRGMTLAERQSSAWSTARR